MERSTVPGAVRDTVVAAAVVTALLAPASARAQDPGSIPASGLTGADPSRDLQLGLGLPYWSGGRHRPFVSSTLEAGLVYYRPQIAVGYGKPHWRWFGAEAQTLVSLSSGQHYGGLRAALPLAEVRLGARHTYSLSQAYLTRASTYTDDTIDFDDQPRSRYLALEAEASGAVPVGDGAFIGSLAVHHLLGVPDGLDVYHESFFVVVEPPWVGRLRTGYVHVVADGRIALGGAVEVIAAPEREAVVLRAGPQLAMRVTHHLDAALSVSIVVASADSLRLAGAEIGQFGFRYRWATGDPFPEFP